MAMDEATATRPDPPVAAGDTRRSSETMNFAYLVRFALAKIRTSPQNTRTFSAVAIATFSLLLCFAAINAMADVMTRSAADVIGGDLSASSDDYRYSMLNPASDQVFYISDTDQVMTDIAREESVTHLRPRLTAGARIESTTQQAGALVIGTDFDAEGYQSLEGEPPSAPGDVCINPTLQKNLDLAVGDEISLFVAGSPQQNYQISAQISCVYDNARFGLFRSTHVVMNITDLQRIIDRPDASTQILISLDPGADKTTVLQDLEANPDFDGIRFDTTAETADLIFTIQTAQQAVMWALVVITALICAILIGNIVGFVLRRERGEIATMRAMGFDPGAIRAVYAIQTLGIGAIMVAIGTAAALICVWIAAFVGIPIGAGQQLFGGDTLVPSLSVVNVVVTAVIMLGALGIANLVSTTALLRRTPLAMLRDD